MGGWTGRVDVASLDKYTESTKEMLTSQEQQHNPMTASQALSFAVTTKL